MCRPRDLSASGPEKRSVAVVGIEVDVFLVAVVDEDDVLLVVSVADNCN